MFSHGEMERKVALKLVVFHTGTRTYNLVPRAFPLKNGRSPGDEVGQLKIIWNLMRENSEDNYEFSTFPVGPNSDPLSFGLTYYTLEGQ